MNIVDAGRRARTGTGLVRRLALAAAVLALPWSPAGGQEPPVSAGPGGADGRDTLPGTIAGRVLSAAGHRPVEGALVEVTAPGGRSRSVITGPEGRYALDGLPPGMARLSVSTLDHAPHRVDVRVPAGAGIRLDVVVELRPPALPALVATLPPAVPLPLAPGEETRVGPAGREADPGLRALEAGPALGALGRGLAARPSPPSDPAGALYVRGATSDLRQVYLDGAPVYAPFHLGGLMEAVPEGVLGSARLYTGGAPLSFDGGLSYVLDLRTRSGGGGPVRTAGHADMLGGAVRAEGSTGRLSYLVSGRRTHEAGSGWMTDGRLPYSYSDLLARADLRVAGGHRLSVTGYTNEEGVRLGGAAALGRRATWGNEAGSLRYEARLGSTSALLTAAASRFTSALPVTTDGSAFGRSETRRARLTLDARTAFDGFDLSYGTAFDLHDLGLRLPADDGGRIRWEGRGESLAAYAAATARPVETLSLRAGLRAKTYDGLPDPVLSPRVALTWAASEATTLRVSTGRFQQRLEAPQTALSSDLDAWSEELRDRVAGDTGEFPALAVATASHASLRLDHRPREELELGLEGYFKTFDELAEGDDLHASGADVWVDWESDRWKAWGGYTLQWAWSDRRGGEASDRRFAGRQLLRAGGSAPLPGGLRLGARVSASSGLPFTRVPLAPGRPSEESPGTGDPTDGPSTGDEPPPLAGPPDGSYLRLDLELSRRWEAEVLGERAVLRPYLRFLNALDRRDALFFQFDPGRELRPRALDTMPLLPVVGLEWSMP